MIQRPQSIFLLLAALALGTLFLPSLSFSEVEAVSQKPLQALNGSFYSDGAYNIMDNVTLMSLTALGCVVSLISIFLFSNRNRQKLLSKMAIVLSVLLIGVAAYFFYSEYNRIEQIAGAEVVPSLGIANPILSIVFLFLAVRFINKDEQLVRSMDRLR